MKLHVLPKRPGKNKKRLGRGISAGGGKTAGHGTKGQKAHNPKGVATNFEGGQTPLARRLPKKRGFLSRQQKRSTKPLGLGIAKVIALLEAGEISLKTLQARGVVRSKVRAVKLVGGELPPGYTLGEGVRLSRRWTNTKTPVDSAPE